MLHRRARWNLVVSKKHLEEKLKECEICAYNQRSRRDTKLGRLNNGQKHNDVVGMDLLDQLLDDTS